MNPIGTIYVIENTDNRVADNYAFATLHAARTFCAENYDYLAGATRMLEPDYEGCIAFQNGLLIGDDPHSTDDRDWIWTTYATIRPLVVME